MRNLKSSNVFSFRSTIGKISCHTQDNHLIAIEMGSFLICKKSLSALERKIQKQIENYFQKKLRQFNLSLLLKGTPFQIKVWRALEKIPYGETLTYGELAKHLKTSPRAVGNACRKNPIPLIIPCHRVVGQKSLGGYGGKTKGKNLERKRFLLALEKNHDLSFGSFGAIRIVIQHGKS